MLQELKTLLLNFLKGRLLPYILAALGFGGLIDTSNQNAILVDNQTKIIQVLQETQTILNQSEDSGARIANQLLENAKALQNIKIKEE